MAVISYLRVSTRDQTTENQQQQMEDAGYQVDDDFVFVDEGISGSVPAAKRPQLCEAIRTARKGDTFLVVAIDRLGRSAVDVLGTAETLTKKGVRLVSLREGFDLSTPVGKMMLHMMAGFAEMERAIIMERTDAGIARARAAGKHCGRPVHPLADRIAQLWSEGLCEREILAHFAQDGWKVGRTTLYKYKRGELDEA